MNTQPITLGELTDLLEQRPQDQDVRFDFCGMVPTGVDSYRGYYDHLAIGFAEFSDTKMLTVADLVSVLRAANRSTFEGYKGGTYRMTRETPMWVANYGDSGSTAVVGIAEECEYMTIIRTAHCEDWAGGTAHALRTLREQGIIT